MVAPDEIGLIMTTIFAPIMFGIIILLVLFIIPHIIADKLRRKGLGLCNRSIVKILKPDHAVNGRYCFGKIVSDPWIFNGFHLRVRVIIRDADLSQSAYYTDLISGSVKRRLTVWRWEIRKATDKELEDKTEVNYAQ